MAEQNKLMNPLRKLEQDLAVAKSMRDIIKLEVVSQRYISNYESVSGRKDGRQRFEREALALIDIANTKPEIMECDPFSILAGFVKAGWTGLSFMGGKLSVYPRKQKIKGLNGAADTYKKVLVVEPDAHGRREILERQADIKKIDEGVVVFKQDAFIVDAHGKKVIKHEQKWPLPNASEETVIAAYCTVHFTDGHSEDVILSLEELKKARAKSQNVSYRNNEKVKDGGDLWTTFYGEACKKSCYNRAYKIFFKLPDTAAMFSKFEGKGDEEETVDTTYQQVDEEEQPESFMTPEQQQSEQADKDIQDVEVEEVKVEKKEPAKKQKEQAPPQTEDSGSFLDNARNLKIFMITNAIITERTYPIIVRLTDIPSINNNQQLREDLGMDSLDLVEFIIEMEKEFNVVIPDDEVVQIKTVGDVIDLIEKKVIR